MALVEPVPICIIPAVVVEAVGKQVLGTVPLNLAADKVELEVKYPASLVKLLTAVG